MVFSSTVFLFIFLPIVLLCYYNPILKSRMVKNSILLLASLGFYAWGEPIFVFLMVLSIIFTWLLGICMDKKRNYAKGILCLGIVAHVGLLFVFKYLTFVVSQIHSLTGLKGIEVNIALPIGISFFTFQLMSYLFDIYYDKEEVQKNPFYLGLYIALFPQLIAGPIVRYSQIADEIVNRKETFDDVVMGMKRFIYGLAKKVLIANYVAQVADNCFDYMDEKTVAMAWLGAICYTLQIYFDFSGYSDMAIGLGRMFGFHFSENFNYPYISRSVTEFWRRWHISLSTWFRDYVYIPLGGNRKGKHRQILNLFAVWMLTGIWHGANWTFLCWGMLYFVVLVVEKQLGAANIKSAKIGVTVLQWFYTLLIVNFAWVMFRAKSISAGFIYMGNMLGIGAKGWLDSGVITYLQSTYSVLLIALVAATPLFKKLVSKLHEKNLAWIEAIWLALIFVATLLQVISATYNPFIYFNF